MISRYQRMKGKRVFFLTGSDEHGQKIANTAAALGIEPIDICDKYAGESFDPGAVLTRNSVSPTTRDDHLLFCESQLTGNVENEWLGEQVSHEYPGTKW